MVYVIKGCSKDEELLIEADSFHACMPYSMQYLQYLTGCSKTRNVLFMRGDWYAGRMDTSSPTCAAWASAIHNI